MRIIRVGVDLAKNVFQAHGVDRNEKPVWQRKLNREEWLKVLLGKIEPGCEIGMEACGGAHHWARTLEAQGYTPCPGLTMCKWRNETLRSCSQDERTMRLY